MGGDIAPQKYSKAMFELSQSMEWTRLEQTLKIGHYGGLLAIPIPDELVCEKIESKNKRRKTDKVEGVKIFGVYLGLDLILNQLSYIQIRDKMSINPQLCLQKPTQY